MAQQTFEELVAAVKQAESRGKRYAADGKLTTSPKGALGEMQVMPKTIKDPGYGVTPAKDASPDEIARVGRDYLQAMVGKYGDTEKALVAYNWGPGSADKWIAAGAKPEALPEETRTYVQRVKGFLGGKDVSRETKQAKTEPTPAEEMMTKALPAGTTAQAMPKDNLKIDVKSMPPSYQAAFALAALADAQDEEDDKAFDENKGTETEKFFAGYKPVNHLASLDLSVKPLTFKDGGDVDAEDLTKPYIGNPNIKKQGEAARRLAALRDVNTLPDPKTYAAVAGVLGTPPDKMGFSVMHPKYNEIREVADPAFALGTALQIAPVANVPGAGRVVGAMEKAVEPAVMRTLERGGKASEMLQALAAPPSQMFVRARPEAAARHAELQAKGLSPEQIRAQNLTHVDNRGNLIEEISDAPAVLKQKTASVPRMYYDMLEHPELKSIYPSYDMPDVLMETSKRKNSPLAMGTFNSQNNTIMGKIRDLPGDDARSTIRGTLLHEGQHAIQSMEGFTEGANPGAFIAYVKARQGKYNADPAVNANVIREMERAYPNIANVADNFTTRLKADKYMQYVVSDPDRYIGETLYRHMPGEVQAELARVRSNLSPEELKATPHEVSMQQLGIEPANILEMNKMGSRPDRYIGDVEYQPYAHGGVVHRAEGSPEEGEMTKLAVGQPQTAAPAPATRSAKELDAYIKAMNPGAKIQYFPENGSILGQVSSKAQDVLNIQKALSPQKDEETKLHELEHSLTFRGGDPLGRPKIKAVDNNYQAYYMLGDWRPMAQFTKTMVENREKLEQFFGRPLDNAYFKPETLDVVKKQHGDTSALFDEQLASLSALEQITGKSLTRDPEMKKLFPNVKVMSVYDALTGPRQTRMDARDLPPSTPQPAYMYRDNPVTQFLHKTLLSDNFYPYQKPARPVKRAEGSPEEGELSKPYMGNPNIRKQGEAARKLAAMRDVNTLPDPKTYAAVSGLLGTPPDEMGFSVMHPKAAEIRAVANPAFAVGTALGVAPALQVMGAGKVAEKTGEAAKMLARDFQQYNQQLDVPGASYAIRNRGTPFLGTPAQVNFEGKVLRPAMSEADDYADWLSRTFAHGEPALKTWLKDKVGAYLRRDFGTESDQMVQAADQGKKLHFMSPKLTENVPHELNAYIDISRELEGFPKAGVAKTPQGKKVEEVIDSTIFPLQLQDINTPYQIPKSMEQFVGTNPEMRVSQMGPIDENLKFDELAQAMEKMFKEKEFRAYGESVPMPKEYVLTPETLQGLTPAQASNRVANKMAWVEKKRGELAGVAISKDPQIVSHSYDNGSKWISPGDLADHPNHANMVKDIGCAGGWCTDKDTFAMDYGSGENRLNILLDKKFEPRVQLTVNSPPTRVRDFILANPHLPEIDAIASNRTITAREADRIIKAMPEYIDFVKQNQNVKNITEIKGQFNNADLRDSPYLKQVQDFVKRQGPDLQSVYNLDGIDMLDMRVELPSMRQYGKGNYSQGLLEKLLQVNGNSYFAGKDEFPDLIKKAYELPNNAARQIQMNMFQLPTERASGGMIERQPTDNRRYL